MAGLKFFGNMILPQFAARLDLARNDTVREDAADADGYGFAGSITGALIYDFIDNLFATSRRGLSALST